MRGYSADGGIRTMLGNSGLCGYAEGLILAQASSITCAGVTTYKAIKVADAKPGHHCYLWLWGLGNLAIHKKVFNAHVWPLISAKIS